MKWILIDENSTVEKELKIVYKRQESNSVDHHKINNIGCRCLSWLCGVEVRMWMDITCSVLECGRCFGWYIRS